MLKKISTALCIATGICHSAYSLQLHPTLSLLGNYTTTQNFMTAKAGAFDIDNRKVNMGFELTNKFYVTGSYFIKTGFRYNTYQSTVSGKDPLSAPSGRPHLLVWQRGCAQASIPVQIGRDFATGNGNRGDVFVGMSAGVLLTANATDALTGARPVNASGTDAVSAQINEMADKSPASLVHTAEFGASYQPFSNAPRFSMGLMCAIHLNKTAPYAYQGVVSNITRGDQLTYDAQLRQQFINYTVMVSYAMGKRPAMVRKSHPLSCPE